MTIRFVTRMCMDASGDARTGFGATCRQIAVLYTAFCALAISCPKASDANRTGSPKDAGRQLGRAEHGFLFHYYSRPNKGCPLNGPLPPDTLPSGLFT